MFNGKYSGSINKYQDINLQTSRWKEFSPLRSRDSNLAVDLHLRTFNAGKQSRNCA